MTIVDARGRPLRPYSVEKLLGGDFREQICCRRTITRATIVDYTPFYEVAFSSEVRARTSNGVFQQNRR